MFTERITKFLDTLKQTLFIIGSGLIIFLAARNSIVWHMQEFWGASGDFWQRQWAQIYNWCDNNDMIISIFDDLLGCITPIFFAMFTGSFIFTFSVFWLANAFLIILDLTGWPSFLMKYKIQDDKNNPLQKEDFFRAMKVALINQGIFLLISPLIHAAFIWRGCSFSPEELPTFHWAVFEITIFTLVEEFLFYYSHRLFHHPKIYRHIHKQHHEWTAPTGLISIYAHPVEHVLSNLLPPTMGPILMGSHLATAWMFWALALISTTIAHCGYHFPFLPSPEAHDFHHHKFNQNYGVLGILDRLHGTDAQFRSSIAYKRHFLLLSLTPVSQQIPDPPKKKPE